MLRVRANVVGEGPSAWLCDAAAKALVREIQASSGLEERLGHGKCAFASGAFVGDGSAALPPLNAWGTRIVVPTDGVPHAFVRFADGSIADVTADQFDESLPKVWFPADPGRYLVGAKASLWNAIHQHNEQVREREASVADARHREWWKGV